MAQTKTAVVTGITGQDGAYLARFLVDKGYIVHGLVRRASQINLSRMEYVFADYAHKDLPVYLHYGDLTDIPSLVHMLKKAQPDEIYNLAAQSHVAVSFDNPIYTANSDGLGALSVLEAIRILDMQKHTRLYQASTSELYGLVQEIPQTEKTPFYPRSPYAVSKMMAYWMIVNYREAYNFFAVNGILFNHESPIRGKEFVTRKITSQLAEIIHGKRHHIRLGNLNALRDWGHAKDYVQMQWLMLQQDTPEDYVIATGTQHSVRDFVSRSAEILGIKIKWEGKNQHEVGVIEALCDGLASGDLSHLTIGKEIVVVDPYFYRPTEVETLLGNPEKARLKLGWQPTTSFENLVSEMVHADYTRGLDTAKKETAKPIFAFI